MATQSKWIIKEEQTSQIVRASTIKPRIDYAVDIVDRILDTLVQRRSELDKANLELYSSMDRTGDSLKDLEGKVRYELEISYAIESLRQVRRSLDSIVGMGHVPAVLSPTISVVRVVRSRMLPLMPLLDIHLGDLSLLLCGVIVDAAHLASSNIDFERANSESMRLLDQARYIADEKIGRRFPTLDL